MNWMTKVAMVVMLGLVCWGISSLWVDAIQPVVGAQLGVASVNGGNTDFAAMNIFAKQKSQIEAGIGLLWLFFSALILIPSRKAREAMKAAKATVPLMLMGMLIMTSGCRKPFDVPEYVEIKPSETAFVFQLEGDTANQAKFDSAKFLESKKVAQKRIQIMKRWNQTGRWEWMGDWIPSMRVVVVDRSPVTREWAVGDPSAGTKSKGADKAIWIESSDSVGFSMGWTCTAYIKEEDAAQYLYWYPSGGLQQVMDTEVRGRIQQAAALVAANIPLDTLRAKKSEIAKAVQEDLVSFFTLRGITITTIGMFGGMNYENPKIQEAIDMTVVSQQEKVNAKAMLEAQSDKNLRITAEATAMAEATRMKMKGEADGKLSLATAEAQGIEAVNVALAKANNNPQLIALKMIEVEKQRATTWNGTYPSVVAGENAHLWVGMPTGVNAMQMSTATNNVTK